MMWFVFGLGIVMLVALDVFAVRMAMRNYKLHKKNLEDMQHGNK